MNPKDMTDAQLNKAVARIMGWELSDPCCEPENYNCLDRIKGQDCEKDSCRYYRPGALQPPDYCNSPEDNTKLKQWLSERDYYWDMTHYRNKRGTEFADEEYMACVEEKPNGNFSRARNSRELRAMAEAFAMALEGQSSKTDSS